jgi:magnesium transporter
MKVLAVVTTLMAPLTLVAGIYGMNFEYMPELHTHDGYFIVLGSMVLMLVGMVIFFRKRGWF